jgi:hypothetical protein
MASLEREFAMAVAHPSGQGRLAEIGERMQAVGRDRRHVLDEAALYASTDVDAAIRRAARAMTAFHPQGRRVTAEESFELAKRATECLEAAMQMLVDDYRKHMKLDPRDHTLASGKDA